MSRSFSLLQVLLGPLFDGLGLNVVLSVESLRFIPRRAYSDIRKYV
jgi:hypothetical protein